MRLPHRKHLATSAGGLRAALVVLSSAATLLLAGSSVAWSSKVPFRATVHAHVFDQAKLSAENCVLHARLYFDAPAQAYAERSKVRNHYRFRARLTLANGQHFESGLFYSAGPGRRAYTVRVDTRAEGCWAKLEQRLVDIDIQGCRGERCPVERFRN